MSVLDRAKAHFSSLERHRLEIPEWGDPGSPLVVTWSPLTMEERRRIYKPDKAGKTPDGTVVIVRAIILKACDAEGKRLFSEMDEPDLMHRVDPDVMARLGGQILSLTIEAESGVEAEKN